MIDQSDVVGSTADKKIEPPTKQHLVDWITKANMKLHANQVIVIKSFLVTALANALGGYEDSLIRNDVARQEIEEVLTEVFGHDLMGFDPSEQPTTDPLASDSDADSVDDSEKVESRKNSDHDVDNIPVNECDAPSSDESVVSFCGPDVEPIDSDCPSC